MRHKWQVEPIDPAYLPTFTKQKRCKVCGCVLHISARGYHIYVRASQVFGDKAPECIDWKEENSKSID